MIVMTDGTLKYVELKLFTPFRRNYSFSLMIDVEENYL